MCGGLQERRRGELLAQDLAVQLLLRPTLGQPEGRLAGQHLEAQSAQGPPVHGLAVARAGQHLWGHVFRGATQGPGHGPVAHFLR